MQITLPAPEQVLFWSFIGASFIAGMAFILSWVIRQVLREYWDFKSWIQSERPKPAK